MTISEIRARIGMIATRVPADTVQKIVSDKVYMKTCEAALYLGIGKSTLERLRSQGCGPTAHRVGPKLIRYHRDELDAWTKPTQSTSEP